jgi:AcrR family transcriptional regulator
MAATVSRLPQQSPARPSRARILAAGRRQLSQNPDASLTDIADAAGVARRTLYQYFPRREALVDALATEAGQALTDALAAAREAAATTVLLTAGVTARAARRAVQAVLREAPAPSALLETALPDPAASG